MSRNSQADRFDQAVAETPLVPAKWRRPNPKGLVRDRLNRIAHNPWDPGILLVSGAAGTGKTTFLSQVCNSAGAPVAWYSADTTERSETAFFSYFAAALAAALPELASARLDSVEAIAAAVDRPDRRLLLVLDDLHTLEGSPAEAALARLVRLKPRSMAIMMATRSTPDLNLSRLRLAGELLEAGPGDLRFRVWEVERLFREEYGQTLDAEELADLTRRTNGWAAGLHLFHLATRNATRRERAERLASLSGSSRLVSEYLADNVVRALPDELRRFLVETSVLRTLTAAFCDRYLGTSGSARRLQQLDRRNLLLFTAGGDCRLGEVLRSHLEDCLVREAGERGVEERYRRAALLYEEAGQAPDALQAFVRAHDEQGVTRLLARNGPVLALEPGRWIEIVPPPILLRDAWLLLGMARRQRAAGRWRQALELYEKAEAVAVTDTMAELCGYERRGLTLWLEKPFGAVPNWNGRLRMATVSPDPGGTDPEAAAPIDRFASGLVHLLAGNVEQAERILGSAVEGEDVSPMLALAGPLAVAIARLLQGKQAVDLEGLVIRADEMGVEALAWVGRAALALADGNDGMLAAQRAREHFSAVGDPWGGALAGLVIGLGALLRGPPEPEHAAIVGAAAAEFGRLGASALQAWCRCVEAAMVAAAGDPRTRETALAAEAAGLSSRLTGPLALVYDALSVAEPQRSSRHHDLAQHIRRDTGWAARRGPAPPATSTRPAVSVACFGEFRLTIGQRVADLRRIKPRARQLLRLLTIHFPQAVHREVIGSALWPDAPEDSVRRSLQVAVSSVRKLFSELTGSGSDCALVREGESYRLQLPPDADVDLGRFDRLQREGKLAEAQGRLVESRQAFSVALDLYKGDLLAEDGPAEWVVAERERCRSQAVDLAQCLASSYLAAGQAREAASVCERAVRIDRYSDVLWRSLLKAHRQAGNVAAEARFRREYGKVLSELGLAEPAAI